ncbi:hypothetical protein Fot_13202 [Forsythia ovata]|uniref:Uncharacterized protein n=1 Tax=Forsythia ovata TaxID=205694 RepID=A0ABD1W2T8_9LAMI
MVLTRPNHKTGSPVIDQSMSRSRQRWLQPYLQDSIWFINQLHPLRLFYHALMFSQLQLVGDWRRPQEREKLKPKVILRGNSTTFDVFYTFPSISIDVPRGSKRTKEAD